MMFERSEYSFLADANRGSVRIVSPLINSHAKARIVAIMALELLVLDGQLHDSRRNWACPFRDCKDNFTDAKTLIWHVPNCQHFTTSKVYCNNCNGRDCFSIQGDHCDDIRDDSASQTDKRPSKKSKTMRKISNIITRSLPGSRPSSRASGESSRSPLSIHQDSFSTASATSSLNFRVSAYSPTTSREWQIVGSGSSAILPREMSDTSRPCELSSVVPAQELPATEDLFPTFVQHATGFTESPVEDLSMDTQIPDLGSLSNDGLYGATASSSGQVLSGNAFWFQPQASIPGREQGQSTQIAQPTVSSLQTDITVSAPIVDGEVPTVPANSASNSSLPDHDVAMAEASVHVQERQLYRDHPSVESSSPLHIEARHGSGDSWLSNTTSSATSPDTLISQHSETEPGLRGDEAAWSHSPATASSLDQMSITTPPIARLQPMEVADFSCPDPNCNYRPRGKRSSWRRYLKKHIATHCREKILCRDCGKRFSRSDNLKTHQKDSCPKARLLEVPSRRPMRESAKEAGTLLRDERGYFQNEYLLLP